MKTDNRTKSLGIVAIIDLVFYYLMTSSNQATGTILLTVSVLLVFDIVLLAAFGRTKYDEELPSISRKLDTLGDIAISTDEISAGIKELATKIDNSAIVSELKEIGKKLDALLPKAEEKKVEQHETTA